MAKIKYFYSALSRRSFSSLQVVKIKPLSAKYFFNSGNSLGKRVVNKYTLTGSQEVSNSPADGFFRFDVGYRFGNGG